jgi:hypothetical protein
LAQLVTAFIIPSRGWWDLNTVFTWNLERFENKDEKDKTKWRVRDIPYKIPTGFNLRVSPNSLHEIPTEKRLTKCAFGAPHFQLAM